MENTGVVQWKTECADSIKVLHKDRKNWQMLCSRKKKVPQKTQITKPLQPLYTN